MAQIDTKRCYYSVYFDTDSRGHVLEENDAYQNAPKSNIKLSNDAFMGLLHILSDFLIGSENITTDFDVTIARCLHTSLVFTQCSQHLGSPENVTINEIEYYTIRKLIALVMAHPSHKDFTVWESAYCNLITELQSEWK